MTKLVALANGNLTATFIVRSGRLPEYVNLVGFDVHIEELLQAIDRESYRIQPESPPPTLRIFEGRSDETNERVLSAVRKLGVETLLTLASGIE